MAVTSITVQQDNIVGDCNLLAMHSPLVFLVDVDYTGATPDFIYVDIKEANDTVLTTFKCIPHSDLSPTERRFMFVADSSIRAYMDDFYDFIQTADSIEFVTKITKEFILTFYDEDELKEESVNIVGIHGSQQFGETPAMTDIFDNDTDFYIAGKEMPVYIYFYNDDVENELLINALPVGAATTIITETFDAWSGSAWATYPTGWSIYSDLTPAEFWRVYEKNTGIADFVLNGNYLKYFSLVHDTQTLTEGLTYQCKIRYRSNSDSNVFMCGYKIGGGGLSWGGDVLPDTSGAWDEVTFQVWNPVGGSGTRYFAFGFWKLDSNNIDVEIDTLWLIETASQIGYYRLKVDDLTADTEYIFYKNSVPSGTKTVYVKEFCTDQRYLKYIDKNGQYRFMTFNKFWESTDDPKLIGKTNKLLTNILSDQSDTSNIGYKNNRTITLVSDEMSREELEKFSDVYTSPRVFLYIGTTTDEAKDWLEVEIESDNLVRARKRKYNTIQVDVKLPENYSISML